MIRPSHETITIRYFVACLPSKSAEGGWSNLGDAPRTRVRQFVHAGIARRGFPLHAQDLPLSKTPARRHNEVVIPEHYQCSILQTNATKGTYSSIHSRTKSERTSLAAVVTVNLLFAA